MGSAEHKFDVKIIGAGIAGLSAGLAIARKGHKVNVYEYNSSLSEYGAGVQLSPNATRNIYSWGIEEGFLKVANQPEVMTMRRYADDSVLGEIPHNPISEWEFGYPWWQVYRPDMQMLLAAAAINAGVEINFGYSVASVDVERGVMTFQDGSTVHADLILGADGINSCTRASIPANADVRPKPFHEFCFRAIVSKEKINSDPETARLMLG